MANLSAKASGEIEPFLEGSVLLSPGKELVSDVSIKLSTCASVSIGSSGGRTTTGVTYVLSSACIKKFGGFYNVNKLINNIYF